MNPRNAKLSFAVYTVREEMMTIEDENRAVEEVRSKISSLLSPLGFKIVEDEDCPDIKEFYRTIVFAHDAYKIQATYDYISKLVAVFLIRNFESEGRHFERIINLIHLREPGNFGDDPHRHLEEIEAILSKEGIRWLRGDHFCESAIPSYTNPIKDPNKAR